MEETNFIVEWLSSQSWFTTVASIIGTVSMVTMFISDKWANKYAFLKQINMVMNWVSLNLFQNKNKEAK